MELLYQKKKNKKKKQGWPSSPLEPSEGAFETEYIMALRSYSVLDILLPSIIIIIQDYSQALNTYKCF